MKIIPPVMAGIKTLLTIKWSFCVILHHTAQEENC